MVNRLATRDFWNNVFGLVAGSFILMGVVAIGVVGIWAFGSVLDKMAIFSSLFGKLTPVSTFGEGVIMFMGGIIGIISLMMFFAVVGYDFNLFKRGTLSEGFTYEELDEITEWCEGVERGDYAWIPMEIPLYKKIMGFMRKMVTKGVE